MAGGAAAIAILHSRSSILASILGIHQIARIQIDALDHGKNITVTQAASLENGG